MCLDIIVFSCKHQKPTMVESVRDKPLEKKELFSATRSLTSVCYSLKLKNTKKYDIHQRGTIHMFSKHACIDIESLIYNFFSGNDASLKKNLIIS